MYSTAKRLIQSITWALKSGPNYACGFFLARINGFIGGASGREDQEGYAPFRPRHFIGFSFPIHNKTNDRTFALFSPLKDVSRFPKNIIERFQFFSYNFRLCRTIRQQEAFCVVTTKEQEMWKFKRGRF